MNDNFYKDSFEVYNISVTQKLVILGFSSKIFFILTSVTSETSWGQTMSFSDLTEASNFSWRSQLSYEALSVELGWELKHSETTICHRDTLTHKTPGLLNWPNSLHRLRLNFKLEMLLLKPRLLLQLLTIQFNANTYHIELFLLYWKLNQLEPPIILTRSFDSLNFTPT